VIADYLLGPNPHYAELLDRPTVESLVRRQADGTDTRHSQLLLSILMLEVWMSSFHDRTVAFTPAPARERVVV
jgi:hypothetical protein